MRYSRLSVYLFVMFAVSGTLLWCQAGISEIEGRWREVSRVRDGAPVVAGLGTMTQETTGKMTTSIGGKVVYEGTATIGVAGALKTIDYVQTSPGDGQGQIRRGIYDIQGERLRICLARPGVARPTEFALGPRSMFVLSVYAREKP